MSFSSRSVSQYSRFGVASPMVHRAGSIAGGAGSYRISSSSAPLVSSGIASGFNAHESIGLQNNGKETMQNLNDRLGNYLDRVRSLEKANSDLEYKIRQFYETKASTGDHDYSHYYDTINKLRSQIEGATINNTKILLQIDNAKLAADDFKNKFEAELVIRVGVDNDISGLRRVLDDLTIKKSDLELDIEGLKEELIFLKKNHEEEISVLKGQAGGTVNVELDSAPPVDLSKILAEVREQYESMIEKNRQEVEAWHSEKCDSLKQEVAVNDFALKSSKSEITELRRTVQSLEIELQSLLNMKVALEGTLSETEARYGAELEQLQVLVSQVEIDLQNVRSDSERHSLEYRRLVDIKTRLEMEIATYRRLLDGEANSYSTVETTHAVHKPEITSSTTVKKVTVVEEIVNGQKLSSKVEEVVQKS
ncbi:keratin, type I cytoskeletal 47 kDa-like [Pelobates fuscus]|uniref:keratin, type I cytoskeletal 47 kDa-like n=1 Tax=Pelobates fuscus TaxID=191477 RepID=UPI002FE4B244